jgi:hypothetical protein
VAKEQAKGIAFIAHYSGTMDPPMGWSTTLPGSLYPILCSYSMEQVKPLSAAECQAYRDRVSGWLKVLPRAWVYGYAGWYPGPWPLLRKTAADLNWYRGQRVTGILPEFLDLQFGTDVTMWLMLRLAWDQNLDVETLLKGFYADYYGAAAADMRRAYELLEGHMTKTGGTGNVMDVPNLYPSTVLTQAVGAVDQAMLRKLSATEGTRIGRERTRLWLTQSWLAFWDAATSARRDPTEVKRNLALVAANDYLKRLEAVDGLTAGGGSKLYVEQTRDALKNQCVTITGSGPCSFSDDLNQGGMVFLAQSRSGFTLGEYGLCLGPNSSGEVVYEVKAAPNAKFATARLTNVWLAYPAGGANRLELAWGDSTVWVGLRANQALEGAEIDITEYVKQKTKFRVRFKVTSGAREVLALDNWGLSGTLM